MRMPGGKKDGRVNLKQSTASLETEDKAMRIGENTLILAMRRSNIARGMGVGFPNLQLYIFFEL